MRNSENQEEVLEALNNIMFEYQAQMFALEYLTLLSQQPEILSKTIQQAVDEEADNELEDEGALERARTFSQNQKT